MSGSIAIVVGDDMTVVAHDGVGPVDIQTPANAVATLDPAATRGLRARAFSGVDTVDAGAAARARGWSYDEDDLLRIIDVRPRTSRERAVALAALTWNLAWGPLAVSDASSRFVLDSTTRANDRGLRIDREHAATLARLYATRRDDARRELATVAHALAPTALRSEHAFRDYLERRFGERIVSTALGAHDGLLGLVVNARRRFIAFDDAAKRMRGLADGPDRVRDFLVPHGAHTGRFTSRGFSIHNLARHPHPNLAELVREREVVLPEPGCWFVSRDLSAMEARVLAYLSGEAELLEQFRAGTDVYAAFAELVWPGARIEKHGEHANLREVGKVAVLSLGFGVGVSTFVDNVLAAVPSADVADLERAHGLFRDRYTKIQSAHWELDALLDRARDSTGVCDATAHALRCRIQVDRAANALGVRLPTGRTIFYRGLAVGLDASDESSSLWYAPAWSGAPSLAPEIVHREDRERTFGDGVVRRRLAPHLLVNNIVQATALDVLVHMQAAIGVDVDVAFSVHDELVVECAADDRSAAAVDEALKSVMSRAPTTLPALAGLPLASSRNAAVRDRYG